MKSITTAIYMVVMLTVLVAGPLAAHERRDHGAPTPPVSMTIAPRAEAAFEDFDLATIAEGAAVEVETPAGPMTATARAGDAYRLTAPWLAKPGRYDLIVTVTAGDTNDILPVTQQVTEARAALGLFNAGANGEARSFPLRILTVGDKPQRIVMVSQDGTRLSGTSSVPLPANVRGVVQLTTLDGKTAQGRFH